MLSTVMHSKLFTHSTTSGSLYLACWTQYEFPLYNLISEAGVYCKSSFWLKDPQTTVAPSHFRVYHIRPDCRLEAALGVLTV